MSFIVTSMNMITRGFKVVMKGIICIDAFKYFGVHIAQCMYEFCRRETESQSIRSAHWLHRLKLFFRFNCFCTHFTRLDSCTLRFDRIPIVSHALYIIEYLFRVDKAHCGNWRVCFARQAFPYSLHFVYIEKYENCQNIFNLCM